MDTTYIVLSSQEVTVMFSTSSFLASQINNRPILTWHVLVLRNSKIIGKIPKNESTILSTRTVYLKKVKITCKCISPFYLSLFSCSAQPHQLKCRQEAENNEIIMNHKFFNTYKVYNYFYLNPLFMVGMIFIRRYTSVTRLVLIIEERKQFNSFE